MVTEEIGRNLPRLREDYTTETGKNFEHFFCPLMMRDEPVELCMGHVIPQSIPDCSRLRVVQRKDIDNFYGMVAEADFGTLIEAHGKGLKDIMRDPKLQRRVKPRFLIDGAEVKYYPFRGDTNVNHSRLVLHTEEEGQPVDLVLAMKFDEASTAQEKDWGFLFDYDCRLAAIVTLIKAAYLTLFRLHGYRWAVSGAGMEIGYSTLGKFFRENRDKDPKAVQAAVKEFFTPYKHMVRPINSEPGQPAIRGTLENNRAGICFGSSGRPFGIIIYVRVGEMCHGVLMPIYSNADSAEAYLGFLNNDHETLRVTSAQFDAENQRWEVAPEPIVSHWPKNDESFEFE